MDEFLTQKINQEAVWALPLYARITGRDASLESFNGTFGGKNASFNLEPLSQFNNSDNYIHAWLSAAQNDYVNRLSSGSVTNSSAERIINCIKDDKLVEFILLFILRTFYRETGISISLQIGANVKNKIAEIKNLP